MNLYEEGDIGECLIRIKEEKQNCEKIISKQFNEMRKLSSEINTLKLDIANLNFLLGDRETQLKNSKFEKAKLEEELSRINSSNNDLSTSIQVSTVAVKKNEALEEPADARKYESLEKECNNADNEIQQKFKSYLNDNFEDIQFYEHQVKFLNSIINDLQNKNTDLKSKIQELQTCISRGNGEGSGRKKRKVASIAPRLFCDFCDEFDLHDTEDCPQQASSDSPSRSLKPNKLKLPPRSYCDICEMFDHETGDCQDDVSY